VDIKKGEFDHILPQMLPGGKAVLFTVRTSGVWDEARIVVQALKTGDRRTLIEGGTDARYVPSGHLIYMKSGTLMAVPFDLARLQTRGAPVAIIEGIMQSIGMLAPSGDTGAGQFSISDSGILVYVLGNVRPAAEASLVWVDRKGVVQPLAAPTREYLAPRLSPDGRQLAVRIRQELNEDLWVYDILRETLTRLTFKGRNYAPVWSPDGKRIVFNSDANGQLNLFWMPADGSGEPERLTTSDNRQDPSSWSPDGREIVFTERYPPTRELRILSMKGMRQSRPYLQTPGGSRTHPMSPEPSKSTSRPIRARASGSRFRLAAVRSRYGIGTGTRSSIGMATRLWRPT
jgi:serine/threonine-protein kinase